MSDAAAAAIPSVMAGAEPLSAAGGPNGALVLHGFTGNPQSMRGLAEAFAAAGFTVEMPRLPGHGTTVEDMLTTNWSDWSAAAEAAYADLAGRCEKVVVAGLSMGGTLTCWLATKHPEIAGIVAINAAVEPSADSFMEAVRGMRETGAEVMDGIGSDIADPDVKELAYASTPLEPLLSLFGAVSELATHLGDIRCPTLIFTSWQDHVVPPSSSDLLAERVSGPVERVYLERSYHVATLDYDRGEIESRSVEFARKVTAG
jgi:carboxylesterase